MQGGRQRRATPIAHRFRRWHSSLLSVGSEGRRRQAAKSRVGAMLVVVQLPCFDPLARRGLSLLRQCCGERPLGSAAANLASLRSHETQGVLTCDCSGRPGCRARRPLRRRLDASRPENFSAMATACALVNPTIPARGSKCVWRSIRSRACRQSGARAHRHGAPCAMRRRRRSRAPRHFL